MQISTNIHMRAGDEVSFRQRETAMWIEFGDAAVFGEPPELVQLRDALNEMIAAKSPERKAA